MFGIIFLVLLVIIAVVLIGMYNSLVQLRVRCDSAWSDIDVQLKRRHDLIPNLVETVKGYAAHEKGTFENIAKFRSQAMQATTPEGKAEAENQLTGALKSLFAVARKLSGAEGLGTIYAVAGFAEPDGRFHPELAALLQRGGARFEYEDSVFPDQHTCGHVQLPAAPVLRNRRRRRPRASRGEVLRV